MGKKRENGMKVADLFHKNVNESVWGGGGGDGGGARRANWGC